MTGASGKRRQVPRREGSCRGKSWTPSTTGSHIWKSHSLSPLLFFSSTKQSKNKKISKRGRKNGGAMVQHQLCGCSAGLRT